MQITPNDLETARKAAGFSSQAAAARWLGISSRTYERWLAQSKNIPKTAYLALSLKVENDKIKLKNLL
ncbi:helix-turn-helix domain-containing protein [Acetobacteraceae bacterium]|nr:helix-turn-helix domain-containing protein [Acetobacteraceae bacterium]